MFTYPSLSPLSGVISPTTFSLLASPVATPRTTPRSTPIPRWISLGVDGEPMLDYSQMMVNMVSGTSTDDIEGNSNSVLGECIMDNITVTTSSRYLWLI